MGLRLDSGQRWWYKYRLVVNLDSVAARVSGKVRSLMEYIQGLGLKGVCNGVVEGA